MIRAALFALVLTATPALADAAADRASFGEMVEACVAENGTTDALVTACMEERLSDIDSQIAAAIETLATDNPTNTTALRAAQLDWEGYRLTQCAYHAEVRPRDAAPRRLFCAMRLGNARLAQLQEGLDFADYEAE